MMPPEEPVCAFCGRGRSERSLCGKLHVLKRDAKLLAAHHKCMQYSSGLTQYTFQHFGGFDVDEVQAEISRGRKLSCSWCKRLPKKHRTVKIRGATAGCMLQKCQQTFHFYCAKRHAETSRRKRRTRKGKEIDLYRVFCSPKHKNDYMESERGKQEFSCDETDDENSNDDKEGMDSRHGSNTDIPGDKNNEEYLDKQEGEEYRGDDSLEDTDEEEQEEQLEEETRAKKSFEEFTILSGDSSDEFVVSSTQSSSSRQSSGKARKVPLKSQTSKSSNKKQPSHCSSASSLSKKTKTKQRNFLAGKHEKDNKPVKTESEQKLVFSDSDDSNLFPSDSDFTGSAVKVKTTPQSDLVRSESINTDGSEDDFQLPKIYTPGKKTPETETAEKRISEKKTQEKKTPEEKTPQQTISPLVVTPSKTQTHISDYYGRNTRINPAAEKSRKAKKTKDEARRSEQSSSLSSKQAKSRDGTSSDDEDSEGNKPTSETEKEMTSSDEDQEAEGDDDKLPELSHITSVLSKQISESKKKEKKSTVSDADADINGNMQGLSYRQFSPLTQTTDFENNTAETTCPDDSNDDDKERNDSEPWSSHTSPSLLISNAKETASEAMDTGDNDDNDGNKDENVEVPGPSHGLSPYSKQTTSTEKISEESFIPAGYDEDENEEDPGQLHGLTPFSQQLLSAKQKVKEGTSFDGDEVEEDEAEEEKDDETLTKHTSPVREETGETISDLSSKSATKLKRKPSTDDRTDKVTVSEPMSKARKVLKTGSGKDHDLSPDAVVTTKGDKFVTSANIKKEKCSDDDSLSNVENASLKRETKRKRKEEETISDDEFESNRESYRNLSSFSLSSVRSFLDDSSDSRESVEDALSRNSHDTDVAADQTSQQAKTSTADKERKTSNENGGEVAAVTPDGHNLENYNIAGDQLSQNFSECVLVIPADAKRFEPVMSEVRQKVAQDFSLEESHIHFWNAITPVPLPANCMLHFFNDIADALQKKDWLQLRQLLLDANTIQRTYDEEYVKKIKLQKGMSDPQLKEEMIKTLVKLIVVRLNKACKQNSYLLGMFTTNAGVNYLSVVISDICDPEQELRSALHQQLALYQWSSKVDLAFASLDTIPPRQLKAYQLQESTVLQMWLTTNFGQLHKVIILPEEEMLKSNSANVYDRDCFLKVKSKIEESEFPSTYESDLPVFVLIHKMDSSIVRFEHYVQAYLQKYADDFGRQRIVCVFYIENLSVREFPPVDLGRSDSCVRFFSAFNPAHKPVTLLIADITKKLAAEGSEGLAGELDGEPSPAEPDV